MREVKPRACANANRFGPGRLSLFFQRMASVGLDGWLLRNTAASKRSCSVVGGVWIGGAKAGECKGGCIQNPSESDKVVPGRGWTPEAWQVAIDYGGASWVGEPFFKRGAWSPIARETIAATTQSLPKVSSKHQAVPFGRLVTSVCGHV